MLINLKKEIVNLKGNSIKDGESPLTLGQTLAEIVLAPHKDKDGFRPLKALEMARKLYANETYDIDQSDLIQLKKIVEENQSYIPLVTGQILETLESLK